MSKTDKQLQVEINKKLAECYLKKHNVSNREAARATGLYPQYFSDARKRLGMGNKYIKHAPGDSGDLGSDKQPIKDDHKQSNIDPMFKSKGLSVPLNKLSEVF